VRPNCQAGPAARHVVGRIVEVLRGPYRPQGSFQPCYEVSYRGLTFYCAAAKLAPISDPDLSTGP
jgi:hypothetical protein